MAARCHDGGAPTSRSRERFQRPLRQSCQRSHPLPPELAKREAQTIVAELNTCPNPLWHGAGISNCRPWLKQTAKTTPDWAKSISDRLHEILNTRLGVERTLPVPCRAFLPHAPYCHSAPSIAFRLHFETVRAAKQSCRF